MSADVVIEMVDVRRRFGEVQALDGIDLTVRRGELLGVLGPNGAGKTTTINVLTTLLSPDSGTASVGGYDVASQPQEVRGIIGLTGQFAALDDALTARENLVLFGRLLKLSRGEATRRAQTLLERFELTDAADRKVGDFSGGMRRRIDLAVSMIGDPQILFLDEPTTGLDPRSRLALWDIVRDLQANGVTILLTTQYLEEADQLADRIVVIDTGRVIAEGTANELKARVGGAVLELTVSDGAMRLRAVDALERFAQHLEVRGQVISVSSDEPTALLDVAAALNSAGVDVDDLSVRHPTLDDVFFALTGRVSDDAESADDVVVSS